MTDIEVQLREQLLELASGVTVESSAPFRSSTPASADTAEVTIAAQAHDRPVPSRRVVRRMLRGRRKA